MISKKYFNTSIKSLAALFAISLVVLSCEMDNDEKENTAEVAALLDIEGEYECTGECIITKDGEKQVITVSAENDKIEHYPGAKESLYQITINGVDNFHEIEIGALSGTEMYTATAQVSDTTYPVLEKYIFDFDETGNVTGFTKIVRNPSFENFKSCVIYGKKL